MTCVCTGISVNVNGYWHAGDLHVVLNAPNVFVFRLNNSSIDRPTHSRQAVIDHPCDAWFDTGATFSTLVVPMSAVQLNDAARAYVAENMRHL